MQESINIWNTYEIMINKKNIKKIHQNIKNVLFDFFKKEEEKEKDNILLKIFNKDIYDFIKIEINKKKKLKKDIIDKLNIVLNYYKKYLQEKNKEDIIILEKAIEKKEEFDYKKYLNNNLDEMKHKNDIYPIIEFLFKKNKLNKSLEEILNDFIEAEKIIKEKNGEKLEDNIKELLLEYFDINKKSDLLNKIFTKEQIEEFLKLKKNENEENNKLKEVLEYYSKYYPSSKKKEINEINDIIKNEKGNINKYLKDHDEAIKMKIREPLINIILGKKIKNEKNMQESIKSWNNYEKMINKKHLNIIPKRYKRLFLEYFKNEKNKDKILKIFKPDIYEFLIKTNQ